MPILSIPVQALMLCGLPPEYYMAERLKAAGAPIEIMTAAEKRKELAEAGKPTGFNVGDLIKRTGEIKEQGDASKQNLIFTWEDEK